MKSSTMAPERWRVLSSRTIFCSVGLVTFSLLATSTSFTIIDTATLDLRLASWGGISTAAAITSGLALCSVVVLTISRVCCSGGWLHRWILPWTGALLAVVAAVLSLNTIILKKINPDDVSKSHVRNGSNSVFINVNTEFALWTLAVISETIFYALIILRRTSASDRGVSFLGQSKRSISFVGEKKKVAPERPPTPPTPLRIVAPPYALPQASMPSPGFTASSRKERRTSWRDSLHSLHQVVRPSTSRTRLLAARSSLSRDSSVLSDTRSISTTTYSDAFDTWDTSNIDLPLREALSPIVRSRGTALEPIPGSRPASPAKALDGFFPTSSSSPVLLERPPTALSYASRHERPPTSQSNYSRRAFVPASRPSSSSTNEAHIHPLFRTDSPTPPPNATPGTVVTASPIGGQIIPPQLMSQRSYSRMRSDSRAGSRAGSRAESRAQSPATFTRADSIDERPSYSNSIDDYSSSSPYPQSVISSYNRTISSEEQRTSRSRSSSPVTRRMTPPIPGFILSASRETLRSTESKETLRAAGLS
jgi:hypothetical protein